MHDLGMPLPLLPTYDANIGIIMGSLEAFFMLWLLLKGVNVEQWENRALAST